MYLFLEMIFCISVRIFIYIFGRDTKCISHSLSGDHIQFHKLHMCNTDYQQTAVKEKASESRDGSHMPIIDGTVTGNGDTEPCEETTNKGQFKLDQTQSHDVTVKRHDLNRFTFKRIPKSTLNRRRSRSIGGGGPARRRSVIRGNMSVHATDYESSVENLSSIDSKSLLSFSTCHANDKHDASDSSKCTTVKQSGVILGNDPEDSIMRFGGNCQSCVTKVLDSSQRNFHLQSVAANNKSETRSLSCKASVAQLEKVDSIVPCNLELEQRGESDTRKKRLRTKRETSSSLMANKLKDVQCCAAQHNMETSSVSKTNDIVSHLATKLNASSTSNGLYQYADECHQLNKVSLVPLRKLPSSKRGAEESISSDNLDLSGLCKGMNGSMESPIVIPSDELDCESCGTDTSADLADVSSNDVKTHERVPYKNSLVKAAVSTVLNKRKLALKLSRNVKASLVEQPEIPQDSSKINSNDVRQKDDVLRRSDTCNLNKYDVEQCKTRLKEEGDKGITGPMNKRLKLDFLENAAYSVDATLAPESQNIATASEFGRASRDKKRHSFLANVQSDENSVRLSLTQDELIDVDELFDEQDVSQIIEQSVAIKIQDDEEHSQTLQEINATK